MSYGPSLVEAYYQMGLQIARVLKGANVADLPAIRPTQFELVINVGTAKALNLTMPPNVFAVANELVE